MPREPIHPIANKTWQTSLFFHEQVSDKVITVVTVTNRPANLEHIATQVCNQTISNPEIIQHVIVIDGKTINDDEAKKLIRKYETAGVNVKIICVESADDRYLFEKLSALRNFGARQTKDPFLAFWDDDNSWDSEHLDSLISTLKASGAAYSWRTLWDNETTPYVVQDNVYPWVPSDPRRSKIIYKMMLDAKILEPGSAEVHDAYDYGKDEDACCVDTGEWLIRRSIFNNVGGFCENFQANWKIFGMTDDQVLGMRFLEHKIRAYCSEQATLRYLMGGISQDPRQTMLMNPPELALMLEEAPDKYDALSCQGLATPKVAAFIARAQLDGFVATLSSAVTSINPSERVPLFPYIPPTARNGNWSVGDRNPFQDSPYAVLMSEEEKQVKQARLHSIDWQGLGKFLEPIIREHLKLDSQIQISVTVFGSVLWKNTPAGDIDTVVVIEDVENTIVNVGSPVNVFELAGVNMFFPADFQLRDQTVDLSVVGRGALLDRSLHSGDLTNIAVWSHIAGVCVKGNPLLQEASDQLLIQEISVSLGFSFKHFLGRGNVDPKVFNVFIRSLKTCAYLARKYQLECIFRSIPPGDSVFIRPLIPF